MVRRSARVAASDSAPVYNEDALEARSGGGKKRKTQSGSSPAAKRGKKASQEKQKSLEDSLDESKPAPPQEPTAQGVELAEVKETIRVEDSGPNGEQEASRTEEEGVKPEQPVARPEQERSQDVEMTDASGQQAAKPHTEEPASTTEADAEEVAPTFRPDVEMAAPIVKPNIEKPESTCKSDVEQVAPTVKHTVEQPVPVSNQHAEQSLSASRPADALAAISNSPKHVAAMRPAVEQPAPAQHLPAQNDELAEAPVEIEGGKDLPSAENGAPAEKKAHAEPPKPETNGSTAVQTRAPDHDVPASILEKGTLYFLFRGRVGVDIPQDIADIARSYILMRPIPHGAKLGEGPIGDTSNCRLLALPKKTLPASGKDRFMVFVEKAQTTFRELRDTFSSSEYETKTLGTREVPPMTPVGEAVYAITTTGRESHLAYILTIPTQIGEVQQSVGLKERGSFIISTKNPQFSGPANASLPQGPAYPDSIKEEFGNLRWMPSQPKHLEYANAQFLIIGESSGLEKATERQTSDAKKDTDTPLQELEKLEGEDEIRVKHLKGDDAIFADLEMSKRLLPPILSSW